MIIWSCRMDSDSFRKLITVSNYWRSRTLKIGKNKTKGFRNLLCHIAAVFILSHKDKFYYPT